MLMWYQLWEKTNDILKPQETVNNDKTLKVSIILFLVVIS